MDSRLRGRRICFPVIPAQAGIHPAAVKLRTSDSTNLLHPPRPASEKP